MKISNDDEITVFIIDDDKILSAMLKNEIRRNFPDRNIVVHVFEAGELCEPFLETRPDIAIVDYHLNSRFRDAKNGIEIIDLFRKKSPVTNVILFTHEENVGLAVEAFEHGAHDYVVKNGFMFRRLNVAIVQCLRLREMQKNLERQRRRNMMAVFIMTMLLACAMILQFFIPGSLLNQNT